MTFLALLCLFVGTVVALPEIKKSCEGPADSGPCMAYFPMYYYDSETDTCESFIFGGCKGNGNRYASEEECLNKCKGHSQKTEDVCSLPPEQGPCRGRFPMFYFDAESGECKDMIYGGCKGNGNRFATVEDCLGKCSSFSVSKEVCSLEHETGPCKAYIPSYYYNSKTGKCEQFIYGGCGGNDNRFETAQQCHNSCSVSKEVCSLEPETGPCRAMIPSYYFDSKTGKCELFTYGGCGGNDNRFETAEHCYNSCSTSRAEESKKCTDFPDSGLCKGAFPRYYFDKNTGKCNIFIYGGCGGNDNRYKSEIECLETCGQN